MTKSKTKCSMCKLQNVMNELDKRQNMTTFLIAQHQVNVFTTKVWNKTHEIDVCELHSTLKAQTHFLAKVLKFLDKEYTFKRPKMRHS